VSLLFLGKYILHVFVGSSTTHYAKSLSNSFFLDLTIQFIMTPSAHHRITSSTGFGVISSDAIESGFRKVDRKFFVPKGNEDMAHLDQPLKEGNVHISAPHIYGSALEALELIPNSPLSFLNVGSGTGYLSCIVAEVLGPRSLNYGVEVHEDVVEHSRASIEKWKNVREKQITGGKRLSPTSAQAIKRAINDAAPHIEIIHGNGLQISASSGESVVGFDRIYIGAAVERENLPKITKLLSPGGVLVGPVDDELVKVVRIGRRADGESSQSMNDVDDNIGSNQAMMAGNELFDIDHRWNSGEFTTQVLSGVRFAPLVAGPVTKTIIPARVWDPSTHRHFPEAFHKASMEVFMCCNSLYTQPLPRPKKPEERINLAAMLPRVLWMEILSFTHRKWFEREETETEFLRKRLHEEQANAAKAQQARLEAEARCLVAERERDVYRLLARRWQSRVQVLLQQQRQLASSSGISPSSPAVAATVGAESVASLDMLITGEERAAIFGLGAMLRDVADDDHSSSENDLILQQQEEHGEEMDEDEDESESISPNVTNDEQQLIDILHENGDDSDDDEEIEFHSLQSEDDSPSAAATSVSKGGHREMDNDSIVMGDSDDFEEQHIVTNSISVHHRQNQPRTVSMSIDDL